MPFTIVCLTLNNKRTPWNRDQYTWEQQNKQWKLILWYKKRLKQFLVYKCSGVCFHKTESSISTSSPTLRNLSRMELDLTCIAMILNQVHVLPSSIHLLFDEDILDKWSIVYRRNVGRYYFFSNIEKMVQDGTRLDLCPDDPDPSTCATIVNTSPFWKRYIGRVNYSLSNERRSSLRWKISKMYDFFFNIEKMVQDGTRLDLCPDNPDPSVSVSIVNTSPFWQIYIGQMNASVLTERRSSLRWKISIWTSSPTFRKWSRMELDLTCIAMILTQVHVLPSSMHLLSDKHILDKWMVVYRRNAHRR